MTEISNNLIRLLESKSSSESLCIISDYDGTLVPLQDDPKSAHLAAECKSVLRRLSELPNTHVVLLSGRSLADLHSRCSGLDKCYLVGSHGFEFEPSSNALMKESESEVLAQVQAIFEQSVAALPESFLEHKPGAVVLHYRRVKTSNIKDELSKLEQVLTKFPIGVLRKGKCVLEFTVFPHTKGQAISRLIDRFAADIVVFIGDDVTDESGFLALREQDLGIKVGTGETAAKHFVESPLDTLQILTTLVEGREGLALRDPTYKINDQLFLSDLRSGCLLDPTSNVSWLSFPIFDSPPLFYGLLGSSFGGRFQVLIDDKEPQSFRYKENTMIAEFHWESASMLDYFDVSGGRSFQRAGRSDFVRTIQGQGTARIIFSPKLDFGRILANIKVSARGLKIEGLPFQVELEAPGWQWTIEEQGRFQTALGHKELGASAENIVLRLGSNSLNLSNNATQSLKNTDDFWGKWLATLYLPTLEKNLVARSALVLRGLSFGPSGAMVAALTTSLPETLGGIRNWDYRFCWPRDASIAARSLLKLGAVGLARRFVDWLLQLVEEEDPGVFLKPIYTVKGRSVPAEAIVPNVYGYAGSQPVRIGNLAAQQLQLDVIGPVMGLLRDLVVENDAATSEYYPLVEQMVEMVSQRWAEPDSGIWEIRDRPRHYTHSKLMCWYTIDKAIEIFAAADEAKPHWARLREEIRTEIEEKAYDSSLQAYVCAYDYAAPDASLLWLALTGFHPPDHSRLVGTVDWLSRELVRDGWTWRYLFDDGLSGKEGAFIICQAWMIETLALLNRHTEAKNLFDTLIAKIGTNELLAEQFDPSIDTWLGNFPQAYSHSGVIDAVLALSPHYKSTVKERTSHLA